MIKAVIFDLDGTLSDSLESLAWSANAAMAAVDPALVPQPPENFKFYAGDGARVMVARCLADAGDPEGRLLDQVMEVYPVYFKEGCLYHIRAYEGIQEALQALKARGIRLAVCSNKAQPNTEDVIHLLFGKDLFDMLVGASPDLPRKPSPAGPLKVAQAFGLSPEEFLYVGDTNTDVRTGLAAGMHVVGVTWGFRPRTELEEAGAKDIIDRPEELLDRLS
ncbi:MAG: HAD family hydrolase [Lachnospiraceae bacterium]|nr:HAD family hydrolase [Lachnospiraceae bacterium]